MTTGPSVEAPRPLITRETIVQTYLELAEENHKLGFHDLAERCERNASAAGFGLELEPPEGWA